MRILLVDDDEQLMEVLANKLVEQRYAVDIASNGEMGWEFLLLFDFDLLVLDWMLPDIDGVELCQQIRAEGYKMPILLLTARDRHDDKVMGLDSGADDYLVKPFNFDELTARIRALLRREISVSSPILEWGNLTLNPKTHEVHCREQLLPLTPKEYGMIELFMRHPKQVFSPGAIINNIWAGEDPPGEEAVRTHIKGLRHKLKSAGLEKDTIKTVYGIGYRLKSEEDRQSNLVQTASDKQNRSAVITQTWLKFKDAAFGRLADLENFAKALVEEQVNPEIHAQAKSSAHKLGGSLGCFGFPKGSKIAKQLEQLLDNDSIETADPKQVTELVSALYTELQHQPFEETVRDALGKNISLLIIDRDLDAEYSQKLFVEAQQKGMKAFIASNLEQAGAITDRESIDVVLHKITFPDGEDLTFLEQLHQHLSELPIVAIAESPQLLDRLDIVRQGVNLTLQYPVEPTIAINCVTELLQSSGSAAKVLILDDDPQVLFSLKMSLQPWGFELTTLSDPQHFWDVLEDVEPDLLVLDIEMPEINGIELCQVLRSDRRYQHLPILFLSVHQDEKTQYQAFATGADDYLCKPVTGSILANRILNRLRRSKLMTGTGEGSFAPN